MLQIVKLLDPIQMSINGTFNPMGAYNAGTDYAVGDQVDYQGSSYIMYNNAAAGTVPTNTSYWGLVASKGDTGANGADSTVPGPAGADGADGVGVPIGGTTGQVLAKVDATDYNTYWKDDAGGIADPGSNGILARTALNTTSARTITGTTNQISVSNGDGVSGNPTLSLPQDIHTGATPTFAKVYLNPTAYLESSGVGAIDAQASFFNVWGKINGKINGAAASFGDLTNTSVYFDMNGRGYFGLDATSGNAVIQGASGKGIEFNVNNATFGSGTVGSFGSNGNFSITGSVASHWSPATDSTYTLGTSSLYWSNTYTDRLYLNSTAYFDGATAGRITASGNFMAQPTSGDGTMSIYAGGVSSAAFINMYTNTQAYHGLSTWYSGNLLYRLGASGTPNNGFGIFTNAGGTAGGTTSIAAFFDFSQNTTLYGNLTMSDAKNIILNTTTGTKIGTATTQKLGFFNATPVVQPSATPANATDLATALTLVNDLKSKLVTLGLIA